MSTKIEAAAKEVTEHFADYLSGFRSRLSQKEHTRKLAAITALVLPKVAAILSKHFPPAEPAVSGEELPLLTKQELIAESQFTDAQAAAFWRGKASAWYSRWLATHARKPIGEELERKLLDWLRENVVHFSPHGADSINRDIAAEARKIMEGRS